MAIFPLIAKNVEGAGGLANSPWPMFRQNLNHTGLSPYDTSANPGKLKWYFTTNGGIRSSPSIGSDGTIYVGSLDGKVYAINPDGTEKWNYTTSYPISDYVISSPAIGSDSTVYIGSNADKLHAINPDGTEKWNFSASNDFHSSPAIDSNGTIYIGMDEYKLYAINPDGTEKWNFTPGNVVASSPAIASDGTIYIGSGDCKLYAINTDGTEKWNFTTGGWIMMSSPAIGSDETIYVGSWDNKLYAINPDGSGRWSFTTGNSMDSSPAIGSDGTIYVGSLDNKLYAINPDGTEKWNFTTGNEVDSSPAIGSDGMIYVGSRDNNLYAIKPDGTEKWNFTTGHYVTSSPAISSDGTIYVGSWDGKLYAIGTPNKLPIADAGPDQTIYLGEEVQFNGSASYDPDGTIVNFEWDFNASDGLWWETGAPPDAFGPNLTYSYNEYGTYTVTLRVTDNNGSMDTDTCEITVLVPLLLPPTLYINVSLDGEDVILYWDPPSNPGIDHYLLYRSTSQTDFYFNIVWVNTSKDNESGEPGPIPDRTMWNDTNAANTENITNYKEQYYYIIRAVNVVGEVSRTSRTVGKWTKTFPQGISTFSLPLEPLETMNTTTDYYLKDMNARYIKWMDPVNHIWKKHGDGGVNDTQMEVGKGYEVKFSGETNYTFTGMPGAMIRYDDDTGFIGFDPNTDARNFTATADPLTGNITLNWTKPSTKGVNNQYHVLRSIERDGFWSGNYIQLANLSFDVLSYTDISNATVGTQYYYMIVPVNETGVEGASTYSMSVWTEEYTPGYDTFGIPLKLNYSQTADWYCNNIPDTVGINFFNVSAQWWSWHSTRMPVGAYDPVLEMTEGYQISTSNPTKFTFIGV